MMEEVGSLFKSSTRFGRFSILLVNKTYEGKGGEQMKRENHRTCYNTIKNGSYH